MFFYASAILLGLTGSAHCLGMCGPIALALPLGGSQGLQRAGLVLSYNAGRAAGYASLGAIAGLAGLGVQITASQQALSLVMGLFLILAAIFPFLQKPLSAFSPLILKVKSAIAAQLRARNRKDLFTLGLLNGFLPCGLVYMALTMALAAGSPATGAAFMFLFGLGTAPAMIALPYFRNRIGAPAWKARFRKVIPLALTLLGTLMFMRGMELGIPYISPVPSGREASCHPQHVTHHNNLILCSGPSSAPSK